MPLEKTHCGDEGRASAAVWPRHLSPSHRTGPCLLDALVHTRSSVHEPPSLKTTLCFHFVMKCSAAAPTSLLLEPLRLWPQAGESQVGVLGPLTPYITEGDRLSDPLKCGTGQNLKPGGIRF